MSKFNPQDKVTSLRGKQYLEVKWRLVWFRDEHPKGGIVTEVISTDPLMLRATITDADGKVLATGHGSAEKKQGAVWSGRELEKAETASIGRALAHAGYGTQFTEEDETDNVVDSPVDTVSAMDKAKSRYNELAKKATELGVEVHPINAKMSFDEIVAAGVELKKQVESKEKAGK